jgi:hypothetical protein
VTSKECRNATVGLTPEYRNQREAQRSSETTAKKETTIGSLEGSDSAPAALFRAHQTKPFLRFGAEKGVACSVVVACCWGWVGLSLLVAARWIVHAPDASKRDSGKSPDQRTLDFAHVIPQPLTLTGKSSSRK